MKSKNNLSTIRLGWLYPELMSTYGDRGNIIVLKNRCKRRNIDLIIQNVDFNTTIKQIEKCDLIFGGGAQDRQQALVMTDLLKNKGEVFKSLFQENLPGLFVCGSPQLLGHCYVSGNGTKLEGLGILDMVTNNPGEGANRCIGNIVCEISDDFKIPGHKFLNTVVGFENHGGRSFLGNNGKPFGKVISGFGNNGEDKTEGAVYNNCIATYLHGPFLSKNPHIADWLILKALEYRFKQKIEFKVLNDDLEWQGHEYILNKYI